MVRHDGDSDSNDDNGNGNANDGGVHSLNGAIYIRSRLLVGEGLELDSLDAHDGYRLSIECLDNTQRYVCEV